MITDYIKHNGVDLEVKQNVSFEFISNEVLTFPELYREGQKHNSYYGKIQLVFGVQTEVHFFYNNEQTKHFIALPNEVYEFSNVQFDKIYIDDLTEVFSVGFCGYLVEDKDVNSFLYYDTTQVTVSIQNYVASGSGELQIYESSTSSNRDGNDLISFATGVQSGSTQEFVFDLPKDKVYRFRYDGAEIFLGSAWYFLTDQPFKHFSWNWNDYPNF